jgi:hypothetical protein
VALRGKVAARNVTAGSWWLRSSCQDKAKGPKLLHTQFPCLVTAPATAQLQQNNKMLGIEYESSDEEEAIAVPKTNVSRQVLYEGP